MLLSSPKARLITFFQDSFNIILSQQLSHDRSYMSATPIADSLDQDSPFPEQILDSFEYKEFEDAIFECYERG